VSILSIAPILLLVMVGGALADAPVPGRYRCYQPPAYTVVAWFDLSSREISVNGDSPLPIRIDSTTGHIELSPGAIPPWRYGIRFSPGAKEGDAERVTIVLASRPEHRPGHAAWARLPRCYLTTH
jgi:hypothetical protein